MAGKCNDDNSSCSLCCKLYGVAELNKPANKWCPHVHAGHGCTIYPNRPESCVDYQCLWLKSQTTDAVLSAELKPNKSKVIFDLNGSGTLLVARVDPAYKGNINNPAVVRFMEAAMRSGIIVYIICGEERRLYGSDDKALLQKIEESIRIIN
jgi:hypothetical protein